MSEAVELHAPDPNWAVEFSATRDLILPCFVVPPVLIEHMGSTAVPGLVAKPIIDIIVLVDDLAAALLSVPALEAVGFIHRTDYADKTKIFLMKHHADQRRSHHLHIHEHAEEVRRHLVFRDQLRADATLRDAYADLKLDLAGRFRDDRMAYSRHKTAFVDAVVRAAGGSDRQVPWDP